MKAAMLKQFGSPLTIEDIPAPELGTGEVIIDVVAARVLSYANEVFSGQRKLGLALPIVPGVGAVGRVRAFGPDATRLREGDWVFCDPTVRSRDDALTPDLVLQGWSAFGEGGQRLQRHHHHGPFAEQLRVPTENVFRLGEIEAADAARWSALGVYLVPYGGLCRAGLRAGETLVISGATGNFGSAGVAIALAMGAGCVIAPGRNQRMLDDLTRRFGSRVRPVLLSGDETQDCQRMQRAAPAAIDCVLDMLSPSAGIGAVRAAAMSVRPHGRGADGGRERQSRPAVCVADAQQRQPARTIHVRARRGGACDPPGASRSARSEPHAHHHVPAGGGQPSRGARRSQWRRLPADRAAAMTLTALAPPRRRSRNLAPPARG